MRMKQKRRLAAAQKQPQRQKHAEYGSSDRMACQASHLSKILIQKPQKERDLQNLQKSNSLPKRAFLKFNFFRPRCQCGFSNFSGNFHKRTKKHENFSGSLNISRFAVTDSPLNCTENLKKCVQKENIFAIPAFSLGMQHLVLENFSILDKIKTM
ncbi:MAG: hypothetical protein IJD43_09400 [Thermoguttaceae bacterium]|nr:hypothetical protein [Thermoguttaceae bacterium]